MTERNIKYFRWFMKSRKRFATCRGVDEYDNFKSRHWTDKNGNPCYNFWDIDAEHPRTAVNYSVRAA